MPSAAASRIGLWGPHAVAGRLAVSGSPTPLVISLTCTERSRILLSSMPRLNAPSDTGRTGTAANCCSA